MNKFVFSSLIASVVSVSAMKAEAQKTVSELTIVYDYHVVNLANPSNTTDNSINTIYVKGNLIRYDLSNSQYTSSTIYDSKTGEAVMLKDVSGQKLLIHISSKNWQDMNKNFEGLVFTNTAESKTIAGYKCTKAVAKAANGTVIIAYYTTDIVPDNKNYNPKFKNLEGLPLEYSLVNDKFKIEYTVSKINLNPVAASKFDIPNKGYREMTYEESRKM
jgi:GLPGLI family protein